MGKDSPSPPPAPDYTAAAQATASGNLDAARVAAKANRVSQYTPYGNLIYTQGGGAPVFDQAGYDKAMQAYRSAPATGTAGGTDNPLLGGLLGLSGGTQGTAGMAPNAADFWRSEGDPDRWTSTIELSPTGQQLLDYSNRAQLGLGQQLGQGLERVEGSLSQPFDYGSVGQLADEAYAAQTARLDPQWGQRESMERTRLANQGLMAGGEAYDAEMRNFNQARNDAYQQARQQAFGLMPQTYQLAQALRSQPLNELNALRTGAQVQNPQFTPIPQQQTTPGPNYLGAAQALYGGQMDQYNAQVGSNNAFMSGLMGIGGSVASALPWGTWLSDRRLKSNIRRIGTHPLGIGIYTYEIFGHPQVGVMADEVLGVRPEAALEHPSGFLMVNYAAL